MLAVNEITKNISKNPGRNFHPIKLGEITVFIPWNRFGIKEIHEDCFSRDRDRLKKRMRDYKFNIIVVVFPTGKTHLAYV